MTYLLKDVRDHLAGSTNITTTFGTRMYPDAVPHNPTYPFINLSDLSSTPEEGLDGEVGTHESIITIDGWTDGTGGREAAQAIAEMIRNRMSGYRGQLGTGVWATVHLIRNQILAADPLSAQDQHRRRASLDFRIIHTADAPDFT